MLLEKIEKREISIAEMNEILKLLFKENNEEGKKFVEIINSYL